MSLRKPNKRSGSALIMLSIMLALFIVPMVGLAIDGAVLFLIRTKLSAAADAAALAGARSLSVGLDISSQTASAQTTARNFFNANFPAGLMQTSNLAFDAAIAQTALKTRTVSIQAGIDSPLYFMSLLTHKNTARVAVSAQASRRDVNIILTLDRSGSMQSAGVCGTMVASAQNFVDRFTNGRDRIGLLTFTGSSSVDYAPTVNFKTDNPSLTAVMGKLACGGNTGTAEALWLAYEQILAIDEPGALNLIVFFTDGVPNGVTADFPVKTKSDTRYSSTSHGSLISSPAGTCTDPGPFTGFIGQESNFNPTGYTAGVFNMFSKSISDTDQEVIDAPGCSFSHKKSNGISVREDIAYIPTGDHWGNSTIGWKPVETYPSGPYQGQVRVDTPTSIGSASKNAADDAARRIRSDSRFRPVIYSIGLGGTDPSSPIDPEFLNRVANTPQSTSYNPTQPNGFYVYAPDASQLASAFESIASEILRLSR